MSLVSPISKKAIIGKYSLLSSSFCFIHYAKKIALPCLFQLVGHVIKGGGIAISGQEQRQLGGGFLEGEGAPPGKIIFTLDR